MNFDMDYLFAEFVKEKDLNTNDVAKNNLETTEKFILFFEFFYISIINKYLQEVSLCIDKLTYLGYSFCNDTKYTYNNEEEIKNALINFAFLLNLDMYDKRAEIGLRTCIDLLKTFI